ncbi:Arc family DNA-binding protein [Rhizobium fabae]|uniref:Putative HicB family RNase H-like nuclease n=1 Tax=Rhizobium fabae TaxID=573179 RepID=A0A7W6B1J9_9HYPH|nr:Arc family DNA-binding protein [Rhizobium fabae]MBB3913870.1 putative HicB family RNase H-like nuclease [Rhizobium fabae]
MAKKQLVKDQDKFIVRLPPGMRERIKEKADRAGMSMNEAVVYCLEQFFPAPATFQDRVDSLAEKVAALKRGSDLEAQVDEITDMIESTLREIANDKIAVTAGFAEKVARRVEEWDIEDYERAQDRPFDVEAAPGDPFDD